MGSMLAFHPAALVTGLTIMLFATVGAMLAYGAVHFGRSAAEAQAGSGTSERRIDMRREVLWTGVAAVLLLFVFVYVR